MTLREAKAPIATDLRALNEHLVAASRLLRAVPIEDRCALSEEARRQISDAHHHVCLAGCHLEPGDFEELPT